MDRSAPEERQNFWGHIGILRTYLLAGGSVFLAIAILAFFYGDDTLITLLLAPLKGETLVFLSPLGPFLFKIQIAIYAGLVLAFPLWLVLLLRFVWPALSTRRRRALATFALCATLLGAASLAVTYFYFLPTTLSVLRGFAVPGTQLVLTAENYISFCLLELAVVFFVLQIPVVTCALSYARVVNPRFLASKRRYAIVAIVAGLAVLTPTTDAVTLLIVSVPAVLLWEIGLAISKVLYTRDIVGDI